MRGKSDGRRLPKRLPPVPPSASLDAHETTDGVRMPWRVPGAVPPPDPSDFQPGCVGPTLPVRRATRREIAFRHSGWAETRKKVQEGLKVAGVPLPRQERFHQCGAACSMLVNFKTGERKLVGSYCRDRFCMPCGQARGQWIAANTVKMMGDKTCRLVTFTQRAFGLDLRTCIDRLTESFTRLRKLRFWIRAVKGGAAFLEVKRGGRSGDWHVHLHVICHGSYLDQRELSHIWLDITGDSYIVDVRKVDDNAKAAAYVSKYVAKPLDASIFVRHLDVCECITALHGRRMCNTFGDWRGVELEDKPDDGEGWIEVGALDSILRLAEQGDPMARGYALLLRKSGWGEDAKPAGPD